MFVYCSKCEYWLQNEMLLEFGQCRRHAPSPQKLISDAFVGAYNNRAIWMYTRINDGCGEGKEGETLNIPGEIQDQTVKFKTRSEVNAFDDAVRKAKKNIK